MKIVAIVPALNEERTIGSILSVLQKISFISNIVVVNDGSDDRTAEISSRYKVSLINLNKNMGKGGAIQVALKEHEADVFLLLDADLIGLSASHVYSLLEPVLSGSADMTIGLFEGGRMITDLAQIVAPQLSGQRALRAEILELVNDLDITRFGVEVAITRAVEKHHCRVAEVYLKDLTHLTKEEKMGFMKGLAARFKMYWEILRSMGQNAER